LDPNNSRDRARNSECGTDRHYAAKSRHKRFVDRATDGRCVPESAHYEDVVLDTTELQRDPESEHQPIGISSRKGRVDVDSNCQSRSDLVALLCFSVVTRDAAHGRSNTIHRITRFGRTGARFSAGGMELWRRGLRSFAAASLAGAHL
jgi:hypothetical protein